MQFGHVLVFLPFIIDQPLNARMMVDKGLGVEVERAKDGSFGRDEVAIALTRAIGSHTLRACTQRTTKDIFNNHKLHDLYLDRIVQFFQDSHN
ncbi:UDP-glycosyltransferase 91C1-like [Salvia divinorum]|uniref:UDP-glycosyltransferase 91C1-like n=1 Tax=Salvia divinorum TaxID=28513 RepID=A0ABD1H0T0_SALDI